MTHQHLAFSTALNALVRDYEAFARLMNQYPEEKQTEPGALGDWSPKQIIDHLTGWVQEANKRYNQMLDGDRDNQTYEIDAFNARSVSRRDNMTWAESIDELSQSMNTFIDVAVNVPTEAREDFRFHEWLASLARDFRNHAADMRYFADPLPEPYPILEFDADSPPVINPQDVVRKVENMPERVVLCFFQEVIESVCGKGKADVIGYLNSEMGKMPVYQLEHKSMMLTVAHPGVGGGLAGTFLEELIGYGGQKFIACGGCGVLDREIAVGHVIVPESAIRDEGTSYHYLPPSRSVDAHPDAITAIRQTLAREQVPYILGKTWTTDAPYRETRELVRQRHKEGCVTVEMEAAAFFAIAQYRDVVFGQLLYGGDDVSGEIWDHRGWHERASSRERLFWLAVETVLNL